MSNYNRQVYTEEIRTVKRDFREKTFLECTECGSKWFLEVDEYYRFHSLRKSGVSFHCNKCGDKLKLSARRIEEWKNTYCNL